jgi:DNA-binding beta-propeller fold protein YncE
MKLKLLIKTVLAVVAAGVILAGCATDKPKQTRRYVWPRLPDPPKIEWIKSYYAQNDFPKSSFTAFVELFLGNPSARQFEKPMDIKSNGKGLVYVTDVVLAGIFVFDLQNEKIQFWGKSADPDAGLGITPFFIALDDKDNIYAVGTGKKEIDVLNPEGRLLKKIDFAEKVKDPGGIAVDSKRRRIYLIDNSDAKVAVFDLEGKHLFTFGKKGDGAGEFNRPLPITINNKGEVIIGDTANSRIQIFDEEGKFLRKFGERGDNAASFQIIKGVAVDSEDNIYVTDAKANQIKIFNTKGDALLAIGTAYSVNISMVEAPGGFLLPQGIHIDKNDSIYVVDQANMRFQHFRYLKDGGIDNKVPQTPESKK